MDGGGGGDVRIREIRHGDLQNGFLESLDSLRRASDLDAERAGKILSGIIADPDHLVFVAELEGRIVGSITLLIEQKFIHGGGAAGHIEDVVVAGGLQGGGIGRRLVEFALDHARDRGCYKTVLDCSDDVRGFYEKAGFAKRSDGMRFDHHHHHHRRRDRHQR